MHKMHNKWTDREVVVVPTLIPLANPHFLHHVVLMSKLREDGKNAPTIHLPESDNQVRL
jgi:hypothetical protein